VGRRRKRRGPVFGIGSFVIRRCRRSIARSNLLPLQTDNLFEDSIAAPHFVQHFFYFFVTAILLRQNQKLRVEKTEA